MSLGLSGFRVRWWSLRGLATQRFTAIGMLVVLVPTLLGLQASGVPVIDTGAREGAGAAIAGVRVDDDPLLALPGVQPTPEAWVTPESDPTDALSLDEGGTSTATVGGRSVEASVSSQSASATRTTGSSQFLSAPSSESGWSPVEGRAAKRTAAAGSVRFGVTIPYGPLDRSRTSSTETLLGCAPQYMLYYSGIGDLRPDVDKLEAIVQAGAMPVVTFEPWDYRSGVDQPQYATRRIADGQFDAQFGDWAKDLAAWGAPCICDSLMK